MKLHKSHLLRPLQKRDTACFNCCCIVHINRILKYIVESNQNINVSQHLHTFILDFWTSFTRHDCWFVRGGPRIREFRVRRYSDLSHDAVWACIFSSQAVCYMHNDKKVIWFRAQLILSAFQKSYIEQCLCSYFAWYILSILSCVMRLRSAHSQL